MLLRNLMAMDIEEMITALPLDAVVMIGGCDKTIPAELMGAISADMPSIVVNVGSMLAGKHEGTRLGACTDCRRLWAAFRAGSLDGDESRSRPRPADADVRHLHGDGHRLDHGLHGRDIGLHAAGLGDRARGVVRALALRRGDRQARRGDGKTGGPKPSELLTKSALRNASVVLQATRGSTNAHGASRRHRRARRDHLRSATNSTASAARCRCCSI